MTYSVTDASETAFLGIAIDEGVIELYGTDKVGSPKIHAWFLQDEGLLVAGNRFHCVIALEAGVLSEEIMDELEARGHTVVCFKRRASGARSAKACCEIAVRLAGVETASRWRSAPSELRFVL